MRVKPRLAVSLACLMTLGLSLWSGLGRSISLDESTTLFWSYRIFHFNLGDLFKEVHTPVYDVALGLWLSVFGFTRPSAASFSAFLAVVSIIAIYRFVARFFDAKTAVLSAFLLALSPLHVYYSHYVRTYSLFIACSTLSSLYYLSLARSPRLRQSLPYLAATFALICSHVAAFSIVAAQWLHFLPGALRRREWARIRAWLTLQSVLALLYSPILFLILKNYDPIRDIPVIYSWVKKPGPGAWAESLVFLCGAWAPLAFLITGLAIVGAWRAAASQRVTVTYLLLWLGVPVLVLLAISWSFHPVFLMRGFAPGVIPLIALASFALARSIKPDGLRYGLVCVIAGLSLVAVSQRRFGDVEGWAELAARVERSSPKAKLILIHPQYASLAFSYYFKPDCFYSPDINECLRGSGIYGVTSHEEADKLSRATSGPIWFLGYNTTREENASLLLRLRQGSHLRLRNQTELPALVASELERTDPGLAKSDDL